MRGPRLYFDANAFIMAVEGGEGRKPLQNLLEAADARSITIVTSQLSIAETLTVPIRRLRATDDGAASDFYVAYSNLFSEASRIETREITKWILLEAAELRAVKASLKLPDAIHLATAVTFACDVLVSDDRGLRNAAAASGRDMSVCSLKPADLDALLARIASAP